MSDDSVEQTITDIENLSLDDIYIAMSIHEIQLELGAKLSNLLHRINALELNYNLPAKRGVIAEEVVNLFIMGIEAEFNYLRDNARDVIKIMDYAQTKMNVDE